jgi:hypothetical protein
VYPSPQFPSSECPSPLGRPNAIQMANVRRSLRLASKPKINYKEDSLESDV